MTQIEKLQNEISEIETDIMVADSEWTCGTSRLISHLQMRRRQIANELRKLGVEVTLQELP